MARKSRTVVLAVAAFMLGLLFWPTIALAETVERVSVDTAGEDANGASQANSISADGRYVAFASGATDLVPSDANGSKGDIFLRDLELDTTELVSVNSSEGQANNVSSQPDISPDGRYVAFQSLANNLAIGDAGGYIDIFVRDLVAGTTALMSKHTSGAQANGDSSKASVTSDDARVYVAYQSNATNLVDSDTNSATDVFLSYFFKTDPLTVVTELASCDSAGSQGANGLASGDPDISADGKYVAYESAAQLALGDTDSRYDVYATEWEAATPSGIETKLVSVRTGGHNTSAEHSLNPSINADGKYVAYDSKATGLVEPNDSTSKFDVFVSDWNHSDSADVVTVKASQSASGQEANGDSTNPAISKDGRYVAFESTATDMADGDSNGRQDIFVRDLDDEVTHLVTVDSTGVQGNGDSYLPAISATKGGLFPKLSFYSAATNLVSGVADGNGKRDVFVKTAPVPP